MPARLFCAFGAFGLALAMPLAAAPALADPPNASGDAAPGVVVTGQAPVKEVPQKTDATGKITDPKDPDFVRCRSEAVLNSRAARVRVCRTNREWAASAREGNRQTQELLGIGRPTQPTP